MYTRGVKVTKVKQAEVTNSHKLLFCKMNKMSHCCVELLQVFTILFLSTGQGFHFGGNQCQAGGGNQLLRFRLQQGQAGEPNQCQAGCCNQLGRFGLQQGHSGGPFISRSSRTEVTNWDDSEVTKVQQAEVANGHKLLFCKMNKMSHCCVELLQVFTLFRWFKFTLKPPNRITRNKLQLAIWDTSAWPFLVKFGHNGP